MWKRSAVVGFLFGVSVLAAEQASVYFEPQSLPWGRHELTVRLDLPEATQGWSYGVCIEDCQHARFLSARSLRMIEPPPIEFGDIEVSDCVISRGIVFNILSLQTVGPATGYEDIVIELEAWEPTTVTICTTATTPPTACVVLVEGASYPVTAGSGEVGRPPIEDLICNLKPLACDAWKVDLSWSRTGAMDLVRVYQDGQLIGEGPGSVTGGVLYGAGAGTFELAVEPVVDGHAGGRISCLTTIPSDRTGFIRGDANQDSAIDLADAITILQHLFREGFLYYPEAADVNADAATDIADPIYLLQYLFAKGPEPPAPFPDCGTAP